MHDRPASLPKLPLLEGRRTALETCVFCPKLCRSECPVSNAAPVETLTPWGKMSMAYFLADGSVPREAPYAAPAWACTGCRACESACDHANDVAGTLLEARAAAVSIGLAPPAATAVVQGFQAFHAEHVERSLALAKETGAGRAPTRLLVGCTYTAKAAREARSAVAVAKRLLGPVEIVRACCGAPLAHAGDAAAFLRQRDAFRRTLDGARRVVAVDPGCAVALRRLYAEGGTPLPVRIDLLLEIVHAELALLARVPGAGPVRYHDPCQLGRGLGLYDEPRAVLTRILGEAPREFTYTRARAGCSGAGGLLPVTMPDVSREITRTRARAHDGEDLPIVTACASSLVAFRESGAACEDIVTWTARALERDGA